MARSRKSKVRIRAYLQDEHTMMTAAVALGGYGEWLCTEELVDLIDEKEVCTRSYQLTIQAMKKFIREYSFPHRFRMRTGNAEVAGVYMETMF